MTMILLKSVPDTQKAAFTPAPGLATLAIAGSVASASGTLPQQGGQARIYNAAAAVAYVRFTVGGSTAVATDVPIPPGAVEVFGVGYADTVSVLLASGTGNVYVTSGEGF